MNHMEVSFDALIENEPFARTVVASFLASLNPTIDDIVEIKTIVSEAVNNAMIHGYDKMEENKVVMKVSVDKRLVTLIIQDYGRGIEDIEKARMPMYTTKKHLEHAGMGLTIIESLADCLEIHSIVGLGTKLVITKRLKDVSIVES